MVTNWLSLTDPIGSGFKKIVFIRSSGCTDYTVSHLGLDALSLLTTPKARELAIPQVVLHSMHQTDLNVFSVSNMKRTPASLLREAIFQLLEHCTSPQIGNGVLEGLSRKQDSASTQSVHELSTIMRALMAELSGISRARGERLGMGIRSETSPLLATGAPKQPLIPPVFWIIDRLDTCVFKGPGACKLYDFVKVLEGLSEVGLKVLATSIYPASGIDKRWESNVDLDGELEQWVEITHGSR